MSIRMIHIYQAGLFEVFRLFGDLRSIRICVRVIHIRQDSLVTLRTRVPMVHMRQDCLVTKD